MKQQHPFAKTVLALLLLVSTYSSELLADSAYNKGLGMYYGVGFTSTNLSFNDNNLSSMYSNNSNSSFEHSDNAFKLTMGYQFDPLVGMEFGYTSFGEIVMTDDQSKRNIFDSDGFYVSTTARQRFTPNIEGVAKLGMFFWALYDDNDKSIEDGQDLTYSVGLEFDLYRGKERTLLIEWERYSFSGVALEEADSIAATLKFNFD